MWMWGRDACVPRRTPFIFEVSLSRPRNSLLITVKEIPQSLPVAPQPYDKVSVQAINLFHISKFLWTTQDDFSRLQPTGIEQIGEAPLALIREETFNAFPCTLVIKVVIRRRRLLVAARFWKSRFSGSLAQVGTQGIGQHAIEGRMQIP